MSFQFYLNTKSFMKRQPFEWMYNVFELKHQYYFILINIFSITFQSVKASVRLLGMIVWIYLTQTTRCTFWHKRDSVLSWGDDLWWLLLQLQLFQSTIQLLIERIWSVDRSWLGQGYFWWLEDLRSIDFLT